MPQVYCSSYNKESCFYVAVVMQDTKQSAAIKSKILYVSYEEQTNIER